MLCFQSLLDLGMTDMCIQRHIIGNVFYKTFTDVFHFSHIFLRF